MYCFSWLVFRNLMANYFVVIGEFQGEITISSSVRYCTAQTLHRHLPNYKYCAVFTLFLTQQYADTSSLLLQHSAATYITPMPRPGLCFNTE